MGKAGRASEPHNDANTRLEPVRLDPLARECPPPRADRASVKTRARA
jgi:hypothetical protein